MSLTLPNIWPIFNFINLLNFDEKKERRNITYSSLKQAIVKWFAITTYLFVAFVAYKYTFPSYESIISLPTLQSADYYKFFTKWLFIIVVRDELIVLFFYSLWRYILYESSISKKIASIKYNPKYPDETQMIHDRWHTLKGTFISSLYEIFVIYYYSHHLSLLQNDDNFVKRWYKSIFWIVFITYFRPTHFYFIHRVLHRWNFNIPYFNIDFGKDILYKYVHSLHHKSYNTSPWSGLSMHFIEHLIYYTSFLFPICAGIFVQHPLLVLYNKWHCNLSPLPSHDGFAPPGGGDYFHWLHHAHFECNYGSASIPLDYWFNTLEDGEKYKKSKQYDSKDKYKCT